MVAKVDLESHIQATCSQMSRDMDKVVLKVLMIKDSSSRKARTKSRCRRLIIRFLR